MPRKKKDSKTVKKIWKVGIYCRLSSDDGDNAESDSIKNQREIIEYYLKKDTTCKIIKYYADDGYSGTSFKRPYFKEMFNDIVNEKIDMVIVKDLSRFGRNYIEVGNYLEQIFPLYGIRFVSINDNIDSYKDPKSINNLVVPFKNLMNDEYARDISNKVRSVLHTKSRNGEWVGGTTPYGYKKDPEDIHKLIIDENEVENVKRIFKMAEDGVGHIRISKILNEEGVLSRKETQRRNKYKIDLNDKTIKCEYQWSTSTIGRMVTNEIYIGNLVYNRTGTISYKDHNQKSKPKEEWIIVNNTHEAIIEKSQFDKIQNIISKRNQNRKPPAKLTIYKYKLKCADCGRGMCKIEDTRPRHISSNYYCRNYKTTSNKCTPHKIRTIDLDKMVLETIIFQSKLVLNLEKTIKKLDIQSTYNKNRNETLNKIERKNDEIEKLKQLKKSSYEDWKFEKITKEEFLSYSKDYDIRINNCKLEIEVYEKILDENNKDLKKDNYWIEHFRRNKKIKELNKDVIDELIDCIYVYEDGNIKIRFKYEDEYKIAVKMVEEMEGKND